MEICEHKKKNGVPCTNNAKCIINGIRACGVHSKIPLTSLPSFVVKPKKKAVTEKKKKEKKEKNNSKETNPFKSCTGYNLSPIKTSRDMRKEILERSLGLV